MIKVSFFDFNKGNVMKSVFTFLLLPLSLCPAIFAQTMSVDMVPGVAGIQDTMISTVSGEEFIVEFIGSNFTNVSGYQFKIVFDSTQFDFLGGDADYGMMGKKNVLKSNGGSITGIFQRQINPPCDSILDVAYTINGTADLSVSGTGLIGIAQFKSKLQSGESGAIKIIGGYLADFNGTKMADTIYTNGICYFAPSVATAFSPHEKRSKPLRISYSNNAVHFELSFENGLKSNNVEVALYDFKGRLEAVLFNGFLPAGHHDVSLGNTNVKLGQGFYICALRFKGEVGSGKIFIGK